MNAQKASKVKRTACCHGQNILYNDAICKV